MHRSYLFAAVVVIGAAGVWLGTVGNEEAAYAQPGRSRPSRDAGNVKVLDLRATEVLETFVRDSASLALDYEKSGEYAKAKEILEAVVAVYPEAPGIAERIKQLDEEILQSNDMDLDLDVGRSWSSPVAQVFKGKPIRIQADGSYKFVANLTIDPEGFPTEDPTKGDMAADVPCGMLMGMVVSPGQKEPKPVPIGTSRDFTPEQDGLLFLGVNAPPGHKCTGKIKVTLSGMVAKP